MAGDSWMGRFLMDPNVNPASPVWQHIGEPGFDPFRLYEQHMREYDANVAARKADQGREARMRAMIAAGAARRRAAVMAEANRRAGFSSAPPGATKFKDAVELQADAYRRQDELQAQQAAQADEARRAEAQGQADAAAQANAARAAAEAAAREARMHVPGELNDIGSALNRKGVAYAAIGPDENGNGARLVTEDSIAQDNPDSLMAEYLRVKAAHPELDRSTIIRAIVARRHPAPAPTPDTTNYF